MWFFVQECAAELPFLSSVKMIFQKFRLFSQILSPIRLGAILCAHAILCAPTVDTHAKFFSVFLRSQFQIFLNSDKSRVLISRKLQLKKQYICRILKAIIVLVFYFLLYVSHLRRYRYALFDTTMLSSRKLHENNFCENLG